MKVRPSSFRYDSGSVDGMTSNKNNQPRPEGTRSGIGWSLESGYITRHLKGCNVSQAPGDLCLTGDHLAANGCPPAKAVLTKTPPGLCRYTASAAMSITPPPGL